MADSPAQTYGTAEHAAAEAITLSWATQEGYISSSATPTDLAEIVVDGLRKRGFTVSQRTCDCGWTGIGNHNHDLRMGRQSSDA